MRVRLNHFSNISFFLLCMVLGGLALFSIEVTLPNESQIATVEDVSDWDQQKRFILSDQKQRISPEFDVDPDFYKRVSFWFDIYARYEGYHKVIHHNLYPWIVYEVVDTSQMADPSKYMKLKMKWYKMLFKNIREKKGNYSEDEKRVFDLLAQATDPQRALDTAIEKIRYQTGQKDTTEIALKRSEPYLDHMEDIFSDAKMPVELTRLPLVESSFDLEAYSRVGAAGIWQFMPVTGKSFLKINRNMDERLSPLKSTHAAAQLLKQNLKMLYGEWPLALTAYNFGPGGLRKAARKLNTVKLDIIVEKFKHDRFSFASANFYACFLAVLYAEQYRDYVFPDIQRKSSPQIAKLKTFKAIKTKELLKTYDVGAEDFLVYNPDFEKMISKNKIVPRNTHYFIPINSDNKAVAVND